MSLVDLINEVRSGDVESVRSFLSRHEVDLNQVKKSKTPSMLSGGTTEVTPLMVACMQDNLDMVTFLLQQGAQVDFETSQGWSALRRAFVNENASAVKLLIENGAQRNIKVEGETPLYTSCKNGDIKMVKALLAGGTHVSPSEYHTLSARGALHTWKYSYNTCPVNTAVGFVHIELVKWLLEAGMKVPYGSLFLAVTSGHSSDEMFETLLKHGGDVNMKGNSGWSVLMQASLLGKSEVVKMLLERGADADHQIEGGEFALMLAAGRGIVKVVQLLLEGGADINLKGPRGCTALRNAVLGVGYSNLPIERLVDTVEVLLKNGAEDSDNHAFTAAVVLAPAEIVELFVNAGAKIEALSWDSLSALVSSTRQIIVLQLLLKNGLDVNCADENGKSLLMCAYHLEVVKILLEHGAKVNWQDNDGSHALLGACDFGENYKVAELLLQKDANIKLCNDNGESALRRLKRNFQVRLMAWFPS